MRHKYADLIIAWANGAKIQGRYGEDYEWDDIEDPSWNIKLEYRIKPEPEPDIFKFADVRLQYKDASICRWDSCESSYANLKLVFDGETGKLKSAEVLK